MSITNIQKRFRQEVRDHHNISYGSTITLTDDPRRKGSVLAAKMLLEDTFDKITVRTGATGIICGCREEASIYRLQEYTTNKEMTSNLLLATITKPEIEIYLKEKTDKTYEVWIPDSPEKEFFLTLAKEFSDIRYGA